MTYPGLDLAVYFSKASHTLPAAFSNSAFLLLFQLLRIQRAKQKSNVKKHIVCLDKRPPVGNREVGNLRLIGLVGLGLLVEFSPSTC